MLLYFRPDIFELDGVTLPFSIREAACSRFVMYCSNFKNVMPFHLEFYA